MALEKFQNEASKVTTTEEAVTTKTIGQIIQQRLQEVKFERDCKVKELFTFFKNLYIDNPELVYLKVRIAEVNERGLYPERIVECFDRKAKKLKISYDSPNENYFTDFEGDDFPEFVNMAKEQGLQVLFDTEEKIVKEEPIRRLYICILPATSTLQEHYVNKIFGSTPYEIDTDEFYDFISEESVYIH